MKGYFAHWDEGPDQGGPGDPGAPGREGRGPHGRGRGGKGGRGGFGGPFGPGRGFGPRGRGRGGAPDVPDAADAAAWFAGRLPEDWFTGAPTVTVDRDEILVVGELPALTDEFDDDAARAAAESGRIARFREDTRLARMEIARQAQFRYGRAISWGASLGSTEELFTTLSAPVMTRLRQPERQVLDTLVDAGVARSRSEALAWCVKLTGQNTETWLAKLRNAMAGVEKVRAEGPDSA